MTAPLARQRALLRFALGSLVRRGGRNVAVAGGLAFLVGLIASVLFLTLSLRRESANAAAAMPDLVVQRLVGGRPALIDPAIVRTLEALPGVRAARPRVWGYLFLPSVPGNLTVVGRPPGVAAPDGVALAPGGRFPGEGEVVLGATLADRLAVRLGDEVGLPPPDPDDPYVFLEVVGRFESASALYTADVALVADADARAVLGVPDDRVTDVAVDLTTPREAPVLIEKIAARIPGARVVDRTLTARIYALTFGTRGGVVAAMLMPALAAFLLLAWDRLTGLDVVERQEIGVLKAVGWGTWDVLAARLWETGLVSLFGTAAGLLAAYAFVYWADAPLLSGALLGWSALYPRFDLVPVLDPALFFGLLGAVVVPFVAVGVVPAWRAAMTDPDEALRGE